MWSISTAKIEQWLFYNIQLLIINTATWNMFWHATFDYISMALFWVSVEGLKADIASLHFEISPALHRKLLRRVCTVYFIQSPCWPYYFTRKKKKIHMNRVKQGLKLPDALPDLSRAPDILKIKIVKSDCLHVPTLNFQLLTQANRNVFLYTIEFLITKDNVSNIIFDYNKKCNNKYVLK